MGNGPKGTNMKTNKQKGLKSPSDFADILKYLGILIMIFGILLTFAIPFFLIPLGGIVLGAMLFGQAQIL